MLRGTVTELRADLKLHKPRRKMKGGVGGGGHVKVRLSVPKNDSLKWEGLWWGWGVGVGWEGIGGGRGGCQVRLSVSMNDSLHETVIHCGQRNTTGNVAILVFSVSASLTIKDH